MSTGHIDHTGIQSVIKYDASSLFGRRLQPFQLSSLSSVLNDWWPHFRVEVGAQHHCLASEYLRA